ncbi:MAG: hypothetical protein K2X43_13270 [Hyphomonadaceae bacterium]|nr:hypothetical protein [Hyphomonadaceae bacterium]
MGHDLKAEVRHTLALVIEHPRAWKRVAPGIRQCRLSRFPYAVVYGLDGEHVIVVALAHLKKRPKYWRSVGSAPDNCP